MKSGLWGHALFLASKMDNRAYTTVLNRCSREHFTSHHRHSFRPSPHTTDTAFGLHLTLQTALGLHLTDTAYEITVVQVNTQVSVALHHLHLLSQDGNGVQLSAGPLKIHSHLLGHI